MKRTLLATGLAASLLSPSAFAGVAVEVNIGWEAPPPMVVVSPGVEVVEDNDEEIFFSGGWYWVERDGVWYHTRDHHGHWVVAERAAVPVFILNHPRGHYRHWKHEEHEEREERHEERKEEKKEVRKEEKREKKHGKH